MKDKPKLVLGVGPYDETCYVCGRVQWGEWVPVGFRHWRHDECGVGSVEWMAKMERISRTPLQEELYQLYKGVRDEQAKGNAR